MVSGSRSGYGTNDECVQVHHCICHRAMLPILDSCPCLLCVHRSNRIEPTATAASSMRGWGFEPHTERMLNAGHGLQLLNMERQEPIFLLQTDEHSLISQAESEWIFYVPQHTCAGHDSGGLLLSHILHAPFATRWYGTNHLLLRLGKVGSVLPTHLLNRHGILVTGCCRV